MSFGFKYRRFINNLVKISSRKKIEIEIIYLGIKNKFNVFFYIYIFLILNCILLIIIISISGNQQRKNFELLNVTNFK